MKELFIKYLKNCTRLSEKSADNYGGGIKVIDQWIKKLFPDFTTCFEYDDYEALNKFAEALLSDSDFKEFNESSSSKNMYSGSLEWYLSFLKAIMLFKQEPVTLHTIPTIPLTETGYTNIIASIRTKPFILLAGISGTGKSRIVRQLARSVWPLDSSERTAQKPSNFEMIQVKPNWHDSSELIGYVSRIGDKPQFIAGDFLKFIAKAWENQNVPYFLCLDEMNLAPVEQYFAEYLSVIESRNLQEDGITIKTDPILKKVDEEWYLHLVNSITSNDLDPQIKEDFLTHGIRIPQNLIVVGTVNMDETTYSFSRKVLDRAMTIEMNDVDLKGGLHKLDNVMPYIPSDHFIADAVEGYDVYELYEDVCNTVIDYLNAVNEKLDKTPFKIAYRTRNEFIIYVVNALRLTSKENSDTDEKRNIIIAGALDEVTSMKILSRIEGDKRKVFFLDDLKNTIKSKLDGIDGDNRSEERSISLAKLTIMGERLKSGYTSFWD